MVATSLDGVLLYGVAASRPAANAVAKGTLYSATDTGVVTQSDGVSTWGTFLSVSATGIPATIVDVKGDLIAATAADTVARLAAGANGAILEAQSGEATGLKWSALAKGSYKRTSADYTTSSTSFVDIDGTNASFTITTGARRVMLALAGSCYHSASNGYVALDVTVDGTRQGGDFGVVFVQGTTANHPMNCSFTYITDALPAGSHTFNFQWSTSGATASIAGQASGGSGIVVRFAVVELA